MPDLRHVVLELLRRGRGVFWTSHLRKPLKEKCARLLLVMLCSEQLQLGQDFLQGGQIQLARLEDIEAPEHLVVPSRPDGLQPCTDTRDEVVQVLLRDVDIPRQVLFTSPIRERHRWHLRGAHVLFRLRLAIFDGLREVHQRPPHRGLLRGCLGEQAEIAEHRPYLGQLKTAAIILVVSGECLEGLLAIPIVEFICDAFALLGHTLSAAQQVALRSLRRVADASGGDPLQVGLLRAGARHGSELRELLHHLGARHRLPDVRDILCALLLFWCLHNLLPLNLSLRHQRVLLPRCLVRILLPPHHLSHGQVPKARLLFLSILP
mmetsp:Transcript_104738/g.301119  ORF Transcript_104738/g.301119 Transcript_104738/m.301119 type:complete len:321 (-) Transcript_104738:784-1746(-)